MKILLDECIDRGLARALNSHSVKTVQQAGWAGIKNGRLLALAEKEFDAFITVDRHLPDEQHLPKVHLGVIVLSAPSNRLRDLLPLVPAILSALPDCKPGLATRIPL